MLLAAGLRSSAPCYNKPDHEKMLCAMRCVSETCYDQTYGPPAEEVRQCYLTSADLALVAEWLLAHATDAVEMNAIGSCL